MLTQVKTDLTWLRDEVLAAIHRGEARAAIHQANLIPPGLFKGRPDVLLPYLVLREHVIDRLFAQNVGYWQANLEGLTISAIPITENSWSITSACRRNSL